MPLSYYSFLFGSAHCHAYNASQTTHFALFGISAGLLLIQTDIACARRPNVTRFVRIKVRGTKQGHVAHLNVITLSLLGSARYLYDTLNLLTYISVVLFI